MHYSRTPFFPNTRTRTHAPNNQARCSVADPDGQSRRRNVGSASCCRNPHQPAGLGGGQYAWRRNHRHHQCVRPLRRRIVGDDLDRNRRSLSFQPLSAEPVLIRRTHRRRDGFVQLRRIGWQRRSDAGTETADV